MGTRQRDLTWLIIKFEGLENDEEMIEFIDGLSMAETKILDKAMDAGLCARVPAYLVEKEQA